MKKSDFLHRSAKRFSLLLIVGSMMISGLYAQNMSRYITLNVANDTLIRIDLAAEAANTPIKIASGDWDTIITAGTSWTDYIWYPSHDTIMTIYGDVKKFDCNKNYTNLTGIDVSHNKTLVGLQVYKNNITSLDVSGCTKLEYLYADGNPSLTTLKVSGCTSLEALECYKTALTTLDVSSCTSLGNLYCYGNKFSTAGYDSLMCSLVYNSGGSFYPLFDESDTNYSKFMATNSTNAIAKGWSVIYYDTDENVAKTVGTYKCPFLGNESRYITLKVKKETLIQIDLAAEAANTPIKIASGDWDTIITAGTDWTGFILYPSYDTIMTIYGDVMMFDCYENYTNLTGIDVSHNKTLVSLYVNENDITSLDVSGCTKLEYLYAEENPSLTTLKASGCTSLVELDCYKTALTTLDVSACTSLEDLDCYETALTTLDVSACKKLEYLDCYDNPSLTTLKVSGCTSLKALYCFNTALTTLDVSACKNLRYLDCYDNPSLRTLKVSGCTSLNNLRCYNSALTTLDVSNCIFLENLYCSNNKLTSLGLTNCINLSYLYCDTNALTSLNVADCINLSTLYCFGNDFSTESFDDLMCSMHANGGNFYPLYSVSDSKAEIFSKTNGQNAIDKGWVIRYRNDDAILAPTVGTATCGAVANMSNAIKLNVIKDTIVKFGLIANRNNMPIKVVSGTWDTSLIIGKTIIAYEIPTFADTMIIYGYPRGLLSFPGIGGEIIGIDASNNVSLQGLEYRGTDLSTLNLKNCPSLGFVNCADNALKSLNVSGCINLNELSCKNNELTKLDVSGLISLEYLYCENNALTSLKINGTDLEELSCGGNKLSVKGYDSIMCYLPERDDYNHGEFYPVINTSDTLAYKSFMQTNANNAIAKYWDIMFSETGNDLPQTIGSYECNGLSIEEIEEALEIVLYPNPAKTMLNIENATEDVHIFDITGRMVMKVNNYGETLLQINVSNLSRGMYFVRIGNYTTKFVKE